MGVTQQKSNRYARFRTQTANGKFYGAVRNL